MHPPIAATSAILLLLAVSVAHEGNAKVEIKTVKLDNLAQSIKANKQKLTVAYVWASYDPVSMAAFPRVVRLQTTLKEKPVAVISFSVDVEDQEEEARKFLNEIKPPFPNYILDKNVEKCATKVAVFVIFNHDGKRVANFDWTQHKSFDEMFAAVEKKVDALLAKK